jgi:hypothetical protein
MVSLDVSALSKSGAGAGYLEALARLIGLAPDGSAALHWVRLRAHRINRSLPVDDPLRQSWPAAWAIGANPLGWTDEGASLAWVTRNIQATSGTIGGWPVLTVNGLPSNRMVALPGEWVTVFSGLNDATGIQAMVCAPARSNGAGTAVLRLVTPINFTGSRRCSIGTLETGVFRVTNAQFSPRPFNSDWSFQWGFEEVLPAEIPPNTQEVDPWSG